MNITIEYSNISKNSYFEDILVDTVTALSKKYPFITAVYVFFKFDSFCIEMGCFCEIKLFGFGSDIIATSYKASFEDAISNAVCEMEQELESRFHAMSNR